MIKYLKDFCSLFYKFFVPNRETVKKEFNSSYPSTDGAPVKAVFYRNGKSRGFYIDTKNLDLSGLTELAKKEEKDFILKNSKKEGIISSKKQ